MLQRALSLTMTLVATCLLPACGPPYHVVELDMYSGDYATVEAVGGHDPIVAVFNEGPGRIDVTFEPDSPEAYGPYTIPMSSVTSWPVPETGRVLVEAVHGDGAFVRVRAMRASGIEQIVHGSGLEPAPEVDAEVDDTTDIDELAEIIEPEQGEVDPPDGADYPH